MKVVGSPLKLRHYPGTPAEEAFSALTSRSLQRMPSGIEIPLIGQEGQRQSMDI